MRCIREVWHSVLFGCQGGAIVARSSHIGDGLGLRGSTGGLGGCPCKGWQVLLHPCLSRSFLFSMWRSLGEVLVWWVGRHVQRFHSRQGPGMSVRDNFFGGCSFRLTSNPRFSSSSFTAQLVSRSNPLMLKEPNLRWVGVEDAGIVFWRGCS